MLKIEMALLKGGEKTGFKERVFGTSWQYTQHSPEHRT